MSSFYVPFIEQSLELVTIKNDATITLSYLTKKQTKYFSMIDDSFNDIIISVFNH